MNANSTFKLGRVASIDVFRALTMTTMIFVNDFWSLIGVPKWLEHAKSTEDFLGFSDVVFPLFLFAVGLSIPFAIEKRLSNDNSYWKTTKHILIRTFALLAMGLYTVNAGAVNSAATGLSKPVFSLLMITGFFLVWNVYPKSSGWKGKLFIALQIVGIALLVYLAVVFRDKDGGIMQKRWWGILGMIGWTYLPCAFVYLAARRKMLVHIFALLAFALLNIAGSNKWLGFFDGYIVSNGAHQVLTMSGIIASLMLSRYGSNFKRLAVALISFAAIMLVAGFAARNFWIISKIQATPTWIFLCTGISAFLFFFLYWLVDLKRKEKWFNFIKTAGTATLTCYLIPYIIYNLFTIYGVKFPDIVREYPVGLIKSLAFALAVIWIAALLGKIRIKLKI